MITAWWEGVPGLDPRCLPTDIAFGDRMAAMACAMRLLGTDPLGDQSRQVANTADRFLDWFADAGSAQDGYVRRLALAIACSGGKTDVHPAQVVKAADRIRDYLSRPAGKRGGWI